MSSQPDKPKVSLHGCQFCKHFHTPNSPLWTGGRQCTAFPDGIPFLISERKVRHDKPYPGDNGIQFEPNDLVLATEHLPTLKP